ncbi:unnamed protein product [Pieris macdunnoughi]|uniref:Reverse transcriptase domain-containing protein n=1 Tax=Pieris macdunnoughi TaxID=345717 RepID=A0A821VTH7_9NEOP|nr:unnamed protein product [Pieris macdunnoughi]
MQGATLSPLLYNLYTSQILDYVNIPQVKILQFADDLLLYSENQSLNIAVNSINTALNKLQTYYRIFLKLEISSEKSSVLVFSKDPFAHTVNISYNNDKIPIVNHHKFLGVVVDDKLKFDKHIQYICQNAMKSINVMRSLAGTFWGSDPKTLNMLYKSIVRSHFDYSSLAYMNVNSTLLRKLDVIQNIGLRVISGAMRTTPINSMEVENCIPPLCLRCLQLAERFCLKELANENSVILDRVSYPVEITQSIEASSISTNTLISGLLPEIPTIMSYIKNLTNNNDLLYKLEKHVEFVWVPSHSGITGNEVVDEATRRDHDDDLTDSFKVPFTDYYMQIKIHLKRRWKEYWNYNTEILNKGQWYSEIQRDLPMIPWYNSFKYNNRKFITCINRLHVGHCCVPAHLKRKKIILDDNCTYCSKENADIKHVLFECEMFNIQRLLLASVISDVAEENSLSVPRRPRDLLSYRAFFLPVFKFISNTVEQI